MRTLAEIDADIAQVKQALENVHGNEAEVYTRIVGYYRSVRNWNKGKREEYGHRKLFVQDNQRIAEHVIVANIENNELPVDDKVARIALYTRKTCPNCPPVKNFCDTLDIKVTEYNVDSEAGFREAAKNSVRSAPTAICYDKNGAEVCRAFSTDELKKIMKHGGLCF